MSPKVRHVLIVEGALNTVVFVAKLSVGLQTGSFALLGDALHSLADMANNVVALVVVRIAGAPPDREHPYGHQRFETLAVFGLAVLLAVLAFEIVVRAVEHHDREVVHSGVALVVMLGVLAVNVFLSVWERYWAKRLDSDILDADAKHTFADVLTTVAIIAGWQLASRGFPFLDTLVAMIVAALVMVLSYGLFRRAIPKLVDKIAFEPEAIASVLETLPGVRGVERVRSRWIGSKPAVDVVIAVGGSLSTHEAHDIADAVETALWESFAVRDVSVHVEPASSVAVSSVEAPGAVGTREGLAETE